MLLSAMPVAKAFNQATLKIDTYKTNGWQLDGISINLNNINATTQKLILSITSLNLPKPFDDISFVNISCAEFVWRSDAIVCQQGHANLQSKQWQSPTTNFAFSLSKKNSTLTLTPLKIAGAALLVQANMHNNRWQVTIDAKNVSSQQLKSYFPSVPIAIKDGKANFKLTASGVAFNFKQLSLNTQLTHVKANSKDGQFSTEKVALTSQLSATNTDGVWHWQNHTEMQKGVLHADPVHFEVGKKPIVIDAKGLWNAGNKQVTVQSLTLKNIKLANGEVFVQASMHDKHWQLTVDGKNINSKQLKSYFPKLPLHFKSGKANVKLTASGIATDVEEVKVNADLIEVTVQNQSGQLATEKLTISSQLTGQKAHGVWQWQTHSTLNKGALYSDPVYLEVTKKPVVIDAKGLWNAKSKRVTVENIHYQHPDTAKLTGTGVISYAKKIQLEKADLEVTSLELQNLFSVYVKPYFDPASVEGVSLNGNAKAHLSVVQQALRDAALDFNNVTIKDASHRLDVKQGSGVINWSSKPFPVQLSHLAWRSVSVFNLPIGPAQVELTAWANNFRLTQSARLAFLGGTITANQLSWYAKADEEPDIAFTGKIDNVSLEKLSKVMNWTPLSGKISGHIPGVSYRDKTLRLGGELTINAFDGSITVTNLASEGLFSDYPVVYSDFIMDNLDLDQITRKFSFGNITGRLSGSVKELTLENWHPTHFFAWLGTPDNDNSRHRISQKAVQNIASIGGGGATDILSRSFLSLFDTFGYDKIGVGCYLNKGVCQMMGVQTTPQGYYLIKGGGLPRIDVMGYNPQVDWEVLVERLGRISTTEEVIVK